MSDEELIIIDPKSVLQYVTQEVRKIGYARVSSLGQDLQVQIDTLTRESCQLIYKDKYTGKKIDRPGFQKLLTDIQPGDTLVLTKLDRLARTTRDALDIIQELLDKHIKIHVLNMGLIDDSPVSKIK